MTEKPAMPERGSQFRTVAQLVWYLSKLNQKARIFYLKGEANWLQRIKRIEPCEVTKSELHPDTLEGVEHVEDIPHDEGYYIV